MKKILIVCYTALALAFIVPLFLRAEPEEPSAAPVTIPGAAVPHSAADEPDTPPRREVRETISVLVGDEPRELDMTDYLTGVVAAEMPASFEEEALRAQAVAARTYALYCAAAHRHADAEVCVDSGCCQAWLDDAAMRERLGKDYDYYAAKLRRAVETTAGEYLTYEGAPAFAAFHSSSAGATEDSGRVWNAVPYLVSVPSPESADTVPGYVSTVDVAPLDLRDSILSFCPDADFTGDAAAWVGEIRRDASGRVESAALGGRDIPGTKLRSLFALRSTAFELEYTGEVFRFTVTGFGHGVGMSQYGANVLAQSGADYREILAHYYPGTTLTIAE